MPSRPLHERSIHLLVQRAVRTRAGQAHCRIPPEFRLSPKQDLLRPVLVKGLPRSLLTRWTLQWMVGRILAEAVVRDRCQSTTSSAPSDYFSSWKPLMSACNEAIIKNWSYTRDAEGLQSRNRVARRAKTRPSMPFSFVSTAPIYLITSTKDLRFHHYRLTLLQRRLPRNVLNR